MEAHLYGPVKRFLEQQGFEVKGEVCGCDLVALKDGASVVVIGELKQSFTLELVLQAIDRMPAADEVWLAVKASRRRGRERDGRVRRLCRMLGFGLLSVTGSRIIELIVEPGPYKPRRDPKRRSRIVAEHQRRVGDPTVGGSTRQPIMTAYRQQALGCAGALRGTSARPKDLKTQFPDAPKILLRNVYGWFVRLERGRYALTKEGEAAVSRWLPPP